jgi:hypothetical protein
MKISVLRMARLGHCCKHGSIIPRSGRVRSRNDMGLICYRVGKNFPCFCDRRL